ncbi:MAG: alpha/beta hydrolase, partial [Acinetobacter sp.]|nr:alpha/beta hydrolase [Acinetobacter sp.]
MLNNAKPLLKKLSLKTQNIKYIYEEFRIYDFGSYALNRLTPKKGYSILENIAYGLAARHRFDLYRTASPRANRPLMVFVHGGAWSHGDKKDYRFVGEAFAKEGFDVVIINYNLAPQHIFPKYIDDLSLAL